MNIEDLVRILLIVLALLMMIFVISHTVVQFSENKEGLIYKLSKWYRTHFSGVVFIAIIVVGFGLLTLVMALGLKLVE